MRILRYQPTRRRLLRSMATTLVGAPLLLKLGRYVPLRPRKVRPEDLPPIPWIGHC